MGILTMEKNNTWRTKDLYVASYLYSQGKELFKIERDGRTCWFLFSDGTKCEELQSLYWSNKGQTVPKLYADAVRSLKDMIFAI